MVELTISLTTNPKFDEVTLLRMLKAIAEPLSIGNWEGARDSLAKLERNYLSESGEPISLDSNPQVLPLRECLADAGFSNPDNAVSVLLNTLERMGIVTIKDLTLNTEDDLRMKGLNMRRTAIVAEAMRRAGFTLAPSR